VRWIPIAVLLIACKKDPWAEVVPAKPGAVRLGLGDTPGVVFTDGGLGLEDIGVDRCDARPSRTSLYGTWWVEPQAPIFLEGGPWCALSVGIDGPLVLEGTRGRDQVQVTLELPAFDLVLANSIDVDGDAFVIQVGADGWLSADDFGPGDQVLNPASPAHDGLVTTLLTNVGLFRDDDDGVLTTTERSEGDLTSP
jgi:hypothetical protein